MFGLMSPAGNFPLSGALIGLDISRLRMGVAACDSGWKLVTPLVTICRRSWRDDIDILGRICHEREVSGLVIGYPLNLDGSSGPAAQSRRDTARRLGESLHLPFHLQDESLTSEAVKDAQREGRLPPARRNEPDDHFAAAIILEDALAHFRSRSASKRAD